MAIYRRLPQRKNIDRRRRRRAASGCISHEDPEWTCTQEPYKHPLDKGPKDPWERCFDVVDKHDKDLCANLKEELSALLIFSSLLLAVVTAFTIESFQWLEEDKEDTIIHFLNQTVRILNDPQLQGTAQEPEPFHPDPQDIIINQLWFLSVLLSLFAVLVGTFCLQWISSFRQPLSEQKRHDDALALRQLRYEGFVEWGVPNVSTMLLVFVQISVALFAIGLLVLLWPLNYQVGLTIAIVTGIAAFILSLTTMAPLIQSTLGWIIPQTLALTQCPFKSPLSWFIQNCCLLVAIIASLIFGWWTPVVRWRKEQLSRESGEEYWRKIREKRGPQKKTTPGFSYYLARGLGNAMEMLIYKHDAIYIVHDCLQDFHGTSGDIETFKTLFGKKLNGRETQLLESDDGKTRSLVTEQGFDYTKQKHLKKDFLNAIALEYFVQHNHKLHRVFLPHRLELFIRIVNTVSMTEQRQDDEWVGRSMACPITKETGGLDVQYLSTDLKIQFLQSIDRFLRANNDRWLIKSCLEGAWAVIATVEVDSNHHLPEVFPQPDAIVRPSSAIQFPAVEDKSTPRAPSAIRPPVGDLGTFENACKSLLETMAEMKEHWPDYDRDVLTKLQRRLHQSKLAPSLPRVFQLQTKPPTLESESDEGYGPLSELLDLFVQLLERIRSTARPNTITDNVEAGVAYEVRNTDGGSQSEARQVVNE